MRRLHNHTFWLYGVLAGLAIREALARAGPDVFLYLSPSRPEPWKLHLEFDRLVLFCLCIFTFYFGAGVFFEKVHVGPDAAERYPNNNYGLDYFFGLIHFVFFFGWALTINDFSRTSSLGISLFQVFLSIVFLYDVAWLIANVRYDSCQEIQVWAESCMVVWVLGLGVWLVVKYLFSKDSVASEEASFLPFVIYLFVDMGDLFSGKQIFAQALLRLLPKNLRPPKPPNNSNDSSRAAAP